MTQSGDGKSSERPSGDYRLQNSCRGPKVKSRPPDGTSPQTFHDRRLTEDVHSDHPRYSQPVPIRPDAPLGFSSPHHIPRYSNLLPEGNLSDAGSLVIERILQARGPGIDYYMDIIPRDMADKHDRLHPTTGTPDHPSEMSSTWQPSTSADGASDRDLSKLADHPDVIRGLYL